MKTPEKMREELLLKRLGSGPAGKLGVGVSGGGDSVALLHLLCRWRTKDLVVLHVDHSLRPESRQEAMWVERLAGTLSVPFRKATLHSPSMEELREKGLEAWARKERLKAFATLAEEAGLKTIVTAHHAQDQVETFLWRLLRGSSLKGLSGIRSRRHLKIGKVNLLFWRPLLKISPDDLKTYLRDIGQDWLEDQTNQDPRFLRNRVRNELLPVLEHLRHGSVKHISMVVQDISGVQNLLQREARAIPFTADCFPVPGKWPASVVFEALREWWLRAVPDAVERFDRRMADRLFDLLSRNQCGRRLEVAGKTLVRTRQGLVFAPGDDPAEKPDPVPVLLNPDSTVEFGGKLFSLSPQPQENEMDGIWVEEGLWPLQIRFRAAGDRFRPASGGGEKKLARWLIDRKIPRHERQKLVIVAHDQQVLWIPGLAHSEKVSPEYRPGLWFLAAQVVLRPAFWP